MLHGKLQGLAGRKNAELFGIRTNDADFRNADLMIDADSLLNKNLLGELLAFGRKIAPII